MASGARDVRGILECQVFQESEMEREVPNASGAVPSMLYGVGCDCYSCMHAAYMEWIAAILIAHS